MKKKILALILAVLMIVAIVPMALISASAETITEDITSPASDGATVTYDFKFDTVNWKILPVSEQKVELTCKFSYEPGDGKGAGTYLRVDPIDATGNVISGNSNIVDVDSKGRIRKPNGTEVKNASKGDVTSFTLSVSLAEDTYGYVSVDSVSTKLVGSYTDAPLSGMTDAVGLRFSIHRVGAKNFSNIKFTYPDAKPSVGGNDIIVGLKNDAEFDPTDEFEVVAYVNSNNNLSAMDLDIDYDEDTFELLNTELLTDDGVFASLSGNTLSSGTGNDGDFLKYTFKVKETAQVGTYDFTLTASNVTADGTIVPVKSSVTVKQIDFSGAINFEGYQKVLEEGRDTYAIRFVVSGNVPKIGDFEKIGFKIKTTNLEANYKWEKTTQSAYKELSDAFDSAPTAEGLGKDYVSSLVLQGVPVELGDITFEVVPYTYIDGTEYDGSTKSFTTQMPYELFIEAFEEDTGDGVIDGTVEKTEDGLLSFGDDGATYTLDLGTLTTDKEVTITFDLYPNWTHKFADYPYDLSTKDESEKAANEAAYKATTGAPVLTINDVEYITNRGYNNKKQYICETIGGGSATTTVNSLTMVTIKINPTDGKGSIAIDQSLAGNSRPNINKSFTVDSFSSLKLVFGDAVNTFKIDNLVITQNR